MMIEKTIQPEHNEKQSSRRRLLRRRKGSVLVLVVGVLAVLAAMALSYITVVRIDRRSTDAYQEQENLQQEVVAVTSYLKALLAADLFGNRMTNASTPKTAFNPATGQVESNWPKAFEDGEYSDYPWTDVDPNSPPIPGATLTGAAYTWDTRILPVQSPSLNSILPRINGSDRSFSDDAWLSPIEPIDTGNSSGEGIEWDTWPQITNLRSAYRYRRSDPNQPLLSQWTRGSGRFVDLGQFLLQRPLNPATPRHGFPGADLTLDQSGQLWRDPPAAGGAQNGPALGVNQTIYDLQMADLQEEFYWPPSATTPGSTPPIQGQRALLPADFRFWADTDGDGRPDARWQQLDALGNAFGKVWVVAARIIDNSALANVNSHINFMDYANPANLDRIGDGRTPADVDLYRLFASQIATPGSLTAHPDVLSQTPILFTANRFNTSFRQENLLNGLRVGSMLDQLDQLDDPLNNPQGPSPLGLRDKLDFATIGEIWPGGQGVGTLFGDPSQSPPTNPLELDLKRVERAAIWRFFGANPLAPVASTGSSYPLRDEIDLRTFNGFNLLRTVSSIEQRFDGPRPSAQSMSMDGFLPGVDPRYEDSTRGPALGPMRSKEWDNPTQSPRTFDNTKFILDNNSGDGNYRNGEQLERQRKDIRHLLTTVSGSGAIGPVPVLNPIFDRQFSTNKVNLLRFTNPLPTALQPFDIQDQIDRIRQPLTDAFAAFMWALAPLATNQPLMSPLDRIDPIVYAQLANDASLHYGGGVAGPAKKIITAPDQIYGGSVTDLGASYAVLRAASLAVNTADAIDNQSGAAGAVATVETPTMVRLFNQPYLDFFLNTPSLLGNSSYGEDLRLQGVIPLGARFPQGDIWPTILTAGSPPFTNTGQNLASLPREIVGDPRNGVTLVGLDRQPFLVQAESLVVYANSNANENAPFDIDTDLDPDDPTDILGSFFAVQLGNPWPEQIDLNGYIVRIDNGDKQLLIDFSPGGATITGGAILPAGQRVVFYFFSDVSPAASPNAAQEWSDVQASIRTMFVDDGTQTREIIVPPSGTGTALGGSAFTDDPVNFFRAFGAPASLPVLLIRTILPATPGATQPTEVLVDRLSPPAGAEFPATLASSLNFATFTSTGGIAARAAVQASIRRPTENSSSGFPAYVVERPTSNIGKAQLNDDVSHSWTFAPNATPVIPLSDITDQIINLGEIGFLKPGVAGDSLNLPAFELFVPDGPLLATSELGQICTFTHMYIHPDQNPPSIAEAWNTSGPLGPGKWATVSEQLGWDAHYLYNNNPSGSPVGLNLNPYLGVLDPSRFILGVGGDMDAAITPTVGQLLPDALAVPLATRVFDAFEAIPTPNSGLVRGRVNINTAPRRILELLPLVDPRDPTLAGAPPLTSLAGWNPSTLMISGQFNGDTRLDWLERYRRRDVDIPGSGNTPSNDATPNINNSAYKLLQDYTTLDGLRNIGQNNNQSPWSLGLVNSGELATMGLWEAGGQISSTSPAFLELGANNNQDNSAATNNGNLTPTDIRGALFTHPDFEAIDDPEERLAIFRALSNIVSTRSDIFTAWFILRAYDPKDIEAITIPTNLNNDNDIVSLMNPGNPNAIQGVSRDNPGLIPSFERRILVIFDRSNVRRPTDRPRILLQVELPIR